MKKKILIFVVFISAFLCFGMSAKAEMSCNYILANDFEDGAAIWNNRGGYIRFYKYLYERIFQSEDSAFIIQQRLTDIEKKLLKHIDTTDSIYEINYKIVINNLKTSSYVLHISTGRKTEKNYDHYWPRDTVYTIQKNSCPDLIFVKYGMYSYTAGFGQRTAPYFKIEKDVYFDDYSDIYSDIEFPEDFENGDYLIGISENTGFKSNYYDNLICVLKEAPYGFSEYQKIKKAANTLSRYGNINNIDLILSEMKTPEDLDINSIKGELKNLFTKLPYSTIQEYNKIFSELNVDKINTCFGAENSSKVIEWLRTTGDVPELKETILWKIILELIVNEGEETYNRVRGGFSSPTDQELKENWAGCYSSCNGAAEPEDCYNSCDKENPVPVCLYDVEHNCTSTCDNKEGCIDECDLQKMLCRVDCSHITGNQQNDVEKEFFNGFYNELDTYSCTNLSSSEEETECEINECEIYKQNYIANHKNSEDASDLVSTYEDMKNGQSDSQQALSEFLGEVKTNMIEHAGIQIGEKDICDFLIDDEVQKYINIVLNIIRIGGPILVIILTGYDAIRLIASSKEDESKQFYKRLKIRLILVVILILVPTLINWLVKIFEINQCKV